MTKALMIVSLENGEVSLCFHDVGISPIGIESWTFQEPFATS
jgi:hypothetical protein